MTTDQTPADQTPADQTPAGQTPAGQTPAGQTPAGRTPEDDQLAEDDQIIGNAGDDEPTADGETFPRAYVQRLREQNGTYRTRAREQETRAVRAEYALFTARVDALGILADPADLPVDLDLLDNTDALRAAAEDLVAAKPHLRRRGIARDTGAHERHDGGDPVSLMDLMRGGA